MATTKMMFDTFPARRAALRVALPHEVEQATKDIAELAARNSRRATGEMADAWDSRMEGPSKGVAFSNDYKSLFHEYGTVDMSAQPMVRPAADDVFPSLIGALTKVVNADG